MVDFSLGDLAWQCIVVVFSGFYTLGSIALVRTMAVDTLLDDAIAKIDPTSQDQSLDKHEISERRFLTGMAIAMFAGGVFLVVQSSLAPLIFSLCLASQLLHISFLQSHNSELEVQSAGRTTTINATIIYAIVTLVLVIAQQFSLLPSLPPEWSWREALGGSLTIGFAFFAIYQFRSARVMIDHASSDIEPHLELEAEEKGHLIDMKTVVEVLVQVEEFSWGIWRHDGDKWQAVDPVSLGISPRLTDRIAVWEDSYDEHWDMDDPGQELQWDKDAEEQHFHEARQIAVALKEEFAAKGNGHVKVSWADREMGIKQV